MTPDVQTTDSRGHGGLEGMGTSDFPLTDHPLEEGRKRIGGGKAGKLIGCGSQTG